MKPEFGARRQASPLREPAPTALLLLVSVLPEQIIAANTPNSRTHWLGGLHCGKKRTAKRRGNNASTPRGNGNHDIQE
jgi:hypothetical protein